MARFLVPSRAWKIGAKSRDEGFALVAVLLFVLLIASVLAILSQTNRVSVSAAISAQERFEMRQQIIGVARVAYLFEDKRRPGQVWWQCKLQMSDLLVSFQQTASLVDLNAGQPQQITRAFTALGRSEDLANAAAQRLAGMTDASGGGAGQSIQQGTPSKEFLSVVELEDIIMMSDFEKSLVPLIFTVDNKTGGISPASLDGRLAHALSQSNTDLVSVFNAESATVNIIEFSPGRDFGTQYTFVLSLPSGKARVPFMKQNVQRPITKVARDQLTLSVASCPRDLQTLLKGTG
ncbi:hypothetical protein G6L63_23570 [Agrobacterium vitis]|uniref:hypothetical protein n=1 Tax=Agrobacterium vitis TaxID=373 RepID=UPI000760CE68|nr:hypothetical protein [Agrobacterium vitis]KAA3505436.1 hypothetical protein DXM22_25120 [Agrobacterium vitis]MCF1480341.1 hypothetical protein [Agrobacterium vitis]MUZ99710.1 hypothetical protein [Agrobacterium vitis]MVA32505.1 hypothetical protein [Agrobacterium vitis]NOJ35382.1 hypothetical protein [Agrobacterium vitis]